MLYRILMPVAMMVVGLGGQQAAAIDFFPTPKTNPDTLIYQVDSVAIEILKTNPVSLAIVADGQAPTGGWSNPRLEPRYYIVPPADGIWDFDFVITPPPQGAIVTQGFVKHRAAFFWPTIPPQVRGVRVHATTNSIETMLASDLLADVPPGELRKIDTGAKNAKASIEVKRPIIIDLQPPLKVSYLEANLTLVNPTDAAIELLASSPCDIVNWEIRTVDGMPVQTEPLVICIRPVPHLTLQPGQAIGEKLAIPLDGPAYQSGDYVLHISFWGVEAEATVNIQVVH